MLRLLVRPSLVALGASLAVAAGACGDPPRSTDEVKTTKTQSTGPGLAPEGSDIEP